MTDHRELEDEAWDRRIDSGLRELAGERGPDVAAAVLRRRAAAATVGAAAAVPMPSPRRWLAAGLLLLGSLAVVATWWSTRAAPAGEAPVVAGAGEELDSPPQDATREIEVLPYHADVTSLPRDLRAVETRDFDDDQFVALVARCPELQRLRVVATTAARRQTDRADPVSITDRGLSAVARLPRLRQFELVGTDGVRGEGLHALEALPQLQELVLASFDLDDAALSFLPRLPVLRALDLRLNHGFGAAGVDAIAACPGLQRLVLRGCSQLHADGLAPLGRLQGLVELDLSGMGNTWRGAATPALAARRQLALQRLVQHTESTGAGMRAVAVSSWPTLQRIDLSECHGLEPEVGQALRMRCPDLREVDVSHCPRIDDTTVAELLGLRRLHKLSLRECARVTATSFDLLRLATQVRVLEFAECEWLTLALAEQLLAGQKRVANSLQRDPRYAKELARLVQRYEQRLQAPRYVLVRELEKLRQLPDDVTHIEVRGLGDEAAVLLARRKGLLGVEFVCDDQQHLLTDTGVRLLGGIRTLTAISILGDCPITANGFAELAPLSSLAELRVTSVALDDAALQVLPRLPALRSLSLLGVRAFGAEGTQAIGRCEGLEHLSLHRCDQLSSSALQLLAPLTALRSFDASEVPGCDDKALQALRGAESLGTLVLTGTAITAAGATALAHMRELEALQASECRLLTTPALEQLPTSLRVLLLDRCPGFDGSAGALLRDRFPGLQTLGISGNDWVDDDVLGKVLELPRLACLEIFDCRSTTAAALAPLRAATTLRELKAMRLGWLTKEVAEQLMRERPELKITSFVW